MPLDGLCEARGAPPSARRAPGRHARLGGVLATVAGLGLGPLAACSTSAVTSVGPRHGEPAAPGAIARDSVPAGVVFGVRLDQPLDTCCTPPHTRFTATLLEALCATDGRVVVPEGAKITGEVVSSGLASIRKQLKVRLLSIDTVAGRAPLVAKVTMAQHVDWNGPPQIEPRVLPYAFRGYGGDTSVGNTEIQGRSPFGYEVETPREVHLPKGAEMQLELVRPIVTPTPAP
jgi:hypothetical protein